MNRQIGWLQLGQLICQSKQQDESEMFEYPIRGFLVTSFGWIAFIGRSSLGQEEIAAQLAEEKCAEPFRCPNPQVRKKLYSTCDIWAYGIITYIRDYERLMSHCPVLLDTKVISIDNKKASTWSSTACWFQSSSLRLSLYFYFIYCPFYKQHSFFLSAR